MSQLSLTASTELDRRREEKDKRDREDDPTPRALVRAIVAVVAPYLIARFGPMIAAFGLMRVLDVCAGYGCWASEFRRWWLRSKWSHIPLRITGVEICEARREHGIKWADAWTTADWLAFLRSESKQFEFILGNPPFSHLVPKGCTPDETMPARLLPHAPAVLLFHQTTNFQRGMTGAETWRRYTPARVWLVPGSVGLRGPGTSSDSRCYQATLWIRGHSGPTMTEMIDSPPDGTAQWRWTVPPGSEEPSEDLPGVDRGGGSHE